MKSLQKKELPGNSDRGYLLLDNGDLFSRPQKRPLLAAGLVADAMNKMRYDAVNLGEREFSHGMSLVKRLAESAEFTLLSANVEARDPLWVPYIIKQISGVRVAVIGVVDPGFMIGNEEPSLTVRGTKDVLNILIPKLREAADICVLLSHTGYEGTVDLVKQVPGIDIAIAGHGKKMQKPVKTGNTIVTAASYNGEFVGVLTINWDIDNRKIDGFNGVLIHLGKEFESDPEILDTIRKYSAMASEQAQAAKRKTINVEQLKKMTPQEFMEFFKHQQEKQQERGVAR